MNPVELVIGAEKLTGVFGCWPKFHDAEVVWMHLDRTGTELGPGPTLDVVIHTFEMTNQVDPAGFYVLRKHVLVHLRFSGVTDLKLDDFNQQNALFELKIATVDNAPDEGVRQVRFDPSWGVGTVFHCTAVAVLSVEPCDKEGRPLRH